MVPPIFPRRPKYPGFPESFKVDASCCPTACQEDLGADGASKGCSYLMAYSLCACCRHTRGRFERTHGGVLNLHTGFSACHTTRHALHTHGTQHTTPHHTTHTTNNNNNTPHTTTHNRASQTTSQGERERQRMETEREKRRRKRR